jgi:hypothetical protein
VSKKYENINQGDRESLEALISKIATDSYNKGLNDGLRRSSEQVRDDIVKMLEDPATMSNWWAMPDKSLGLYGNLKNYVIALIKGENK